VREKGEHYALARGRPLVLPHPPVCAAGGECVCVEGSPEVAEGRVREQDGSLRVLLHGASSKMHRQAGTTLRWLARRL
jgi:hypothetical protein